MRKKKFDLAIVGGGILGTSHALHALQMGLSVILFEKNKKVQGASVRNFGQIVPSGMDAKWQSFGRESLNIYKELQKEVDLSIREEGTIYLASNEEEMTLLEELAQINQDNAYPSQLLSQSACLERYDGLKAAYCRGGLYFPEEVNVDPRVLVDRLHLYLINRYGLVLKSSTRISQIEEKNSSVLLRDVYNNKYEATNVLVCNGVEFQSLYPEIFEQSDLLCVKLQMLQTKPIHNQRLPGSILSGLSIRRYESFSACPSYKSIKVKEDPNSLARKYGVHILFKQSVDGSIIIGDSHEYATVKNQDDLGFDQIEDINRYILEEAAQIFEMDNWEIDKTWYGLYGQSQNSDLFLHRISKHINIATGIGGKGMTGSPGFAKHHLKNILV